MAMRHTVFHVAVLLLLFGAPVSGQSAKDVVDRAIKAHAEKPEDLAKRRVERILLEGKINYGMEVPITREIIAEWPSRVRYNNTLKTPQADQRINVSLNGERGWRMSTEQGFEEFNLNQVDEFKAEAHGRWLATVHPLKEGPFKLTLLEENRVDGEEVQLIKVSARFRPDVIMFFSKKSGLLLKVSYKTTESGTSVRKEHIYSEYKKVDGLFVPGKLVDVQNGNKVAVYSVKEHKFLDKQPAGAFEKPSGK